MIYFDSFTFGDGLVLFWHECSDACEISGLVVSPLATIALKLCVVGDTGLKTGWVRYRHGAGRGGVGLGGVITYFSDRTGTMLQMLLLSPGKCLCVCK